MKIEKKFYVGTDKVFIDKPYGPYKGTWAKHTLDEAIEHGKQILENEPEKQSVFVVKVIRVIRRKEQPVIVEVVR